MYAQQYGPGSPPRTRPPVVTGAVVALFVAILASLGETAIEVMMINFIADQVGTSSTFTASDMTGFKISFGILIGLNAIVALGLGLGAAQLMRGMNGGRIMVWVFGGVAVLIRLCCLSGGVILGLAGSAAKAGDTYFPAWQTWGTVITSLVALIAAGAAMIMLMVGSANEYFRKTPAAPQPGQQQQPPQYWR